MIVRRLWTPSRSSLPPLRSASTLRKLVSWPHPEWWVIALSIVSWGVIIAWSSDFAHLTAIDDHVHSSAVTSSFLQATAVAAGMWMLMVFAMMIPLVVGPVRITAARSLWCRRHRAIGGFLIGYLAVWAMVGVMVIPLLAVSPIASNGLAAAGFAVAALWHRTPARRRALSACHRTAPLAPTGWRADVACVRYGWSTGRYCVASCWALMLACLLAGHRPVAMACAAVLMVDERYSFRPRVRLGTLALVAVAALYAGAAIR